MNDTAFWDSRRNRIRTRKGGWRIGRGISVHGHSLLGDLVGSHGFFDVLYLEVTGRLPDPRLAQWIEASAAIAGELSPDEQAAILGGNAVRVYRL